MNMPQNFHFLHLIWYVSQCTAFLISIWYMIGISLGYAWYTKMTKILTVTEDV